MATISGCNPRFVHRPGPILPGHPRPLKHVRYPGDLPSKEKRRMTIAAGFRCADGVVIGADSRIEDGFIKWDEEKVHVCLHDEDDAVLVAGAGETYRILDCVDRLRSSRISDARGSIRRLKQALRRFSESRAYRDLVKPSDGHPPPIDGLIFAIRSHGETDLLHLAGQALYPIKTYACIGSGYAVCRYLADLLYSPDTTADVFLRVLMFIFREAKRLNAGVGGPSHVYRLFNGEKGKGTPQGTAGRIDEQDLIQDLFKALKPLIWHTATRTRESFKQTDECLAKVNRELQQIVRRSLSSH